MDKPAETPEPAETQPVAKPAHACPNCDGALLPIGDHSTTPEAERLFYCKADRFEVDAKGNARDADVIARLRSLEHDRDLIKNGGKEAAAALEEGGFTDMLGMLGGGVTAAFGAITDALSNMGKNDGGKR